MPRPKRTRVAPSGPIARGARENTKDQVEDNNEESEATNARRITKHNGRDVLAAFENDQEVPGRMITMGYQQTAVLNASKKRRDEAMGRLDRENCTSSTRELETKNAQTSSSPDIEVSRRHVAMPGPQTPILARQRNVLGKEPSTARSSSVELSLGQSNGPTNIPPMEKTILGRSNFRRRQRQPSILGRADSRGRSSSEGPASIASTPANVESGIRTSIFKRRARQPSILGTAKKARDKRTGYDYDGEDDFSPDDESTPLNVAKIRSATELESQTASSGTNPRKRKLSPIEYPRSSPPLSTDDREEQATGTLSSPPALVEQAMRPSTPEPLSDTMDPPRSSSSSQESPQILRPSGRTNIQSATRSTRRQPARKPLAPPEADSLPSSPPSLTHSPNVPTFQARAKATGKPKPVPASFSTEQLQALLPRRRHRPAHDVLGPASSEDEEVDTNDLRSYEDELAHLTARPARATRPKLPPPRRVTRLKPGPKVQANAKTTAPSSKPGARKTYASRNAASDKENEDAGLNDDEEADPDDSLAPLPDAPPPSSEENSQELEARVGIELKRAKRKFEVVDKWELEFEDMTGGSSSPWDAR